GKATGQGLSCQTRERPPPRLKGGRSEFGDHARLSPLGTTRWRVSSVAQLPAASYTGPERPSPRASGRRSRQAVTPGCQSGDRPRLASLAMGPDRLHQEHALPAREAARLAGGWEAHAPAARAGGSGQSGRQVDDPSRRVESRTVFRLEVQAMSRHAI